MEKGIYLDIDMDFFVEPIEITSVDNIRLYHDRKSTALAVTPIVDKLREKGLSWDSSKVSCFTNHKVSYTHWWILKKSDNILIHIDAHSDMYRNSNQDLRKLHNGDIGCYNYIWYAIRDNYVGEVYWVIPDSLQEMLRQEAAARIINKNLIVDCTEDEKGLHIVMECIVITGELKRVPVHVCTVSQLPNFIGRCDKVTIATSPEFIPAASDELVFELLHAFDAPKDMAENIYRQHKSMLNKTPEELEQAWEKLKNKGQP